jgi:hypothetical protein
MLLIAQPKSASTSLKYSIVENAFKNNTLKDRKEIYNVNCDIFTEMQKIFTTIYDFDSKQLWKMLYNRNYIYKKHVLPTSRHLKIIDNLKINCVLLLRNVEESINNLETHKKNHKSVYSWDYDLDLLKKEFNLFYNNWFDFSKNRSYILNIYYKDLILNYHNTMDMIFNHFKLRKRVFYEELQKINYTGNGIKKYMEKKCY